MKNDAILDNNNRCIYCGDIIPEGRQICHVCYDILTNGKIWKADKSQGVYRKGHVYFSYAKESCCIDLTIRFGEGNEPMSLPDKRLLSCIYKAHDGTYNYGELVEDNLL